MPYMICMSQLLVPPKLAIMQQSITEELQQEHQQQQPHAVTTLLDLPSHLLAPHLQGLAPQHRLALLQSCKVLRGLLVSSAPSLQLSIAISKLGCCTPPPICTQCSMGCHPMLSPAPAPASHTA